MTLPSPVRVINEDIWFDWECGRVTLQWHIWNPEWHQCWGKVRVHYEPGKLEWHTFADVWVRNRSYYLGGFVIVDKTQTPPTSEHKALHRYLRSFGLTEKKRHRVRELTNAPA